MLQYTRNRKHNSKEGITMELKDILKKVDHTLLKQEATWEQIKAICDDGMKFNTASICIPPSYVKECADYCNGKISVCTVIGFPNGYNTTACKVFETADAVKNGADEIDMVINIGWLKDKKYDLILNEIKEIKKACGDKILKVIIETCLLTDDEKKEMCRIVTEAGADFIKTSTGFSTGGATFDDIKLFSDNIGEGVRMKAAGGIASLDDAEKFLSLGAERLGTSRVVSIAKSEQGSGY
jgi:deoxyribose-phosphate aldolase